MRKVLALLFLLMTAVTANAAGVPPFSIGMNLVGIGPGTGEHPFLNIIKQGGGWITVNSGATDTSEEVQLYQNCLDANGYVTAMPCNALTFVKLMLLILDNTNSSDVSQPTYQAGDYLLQWNGDGNFSFQFDSSATCTTSPCKVTISSPTSNGVRLFQTCTGIGCAGGSTHATNLSFIYCGTYTSTNPTGQKCSYNSAGTTTGCASNGLTCSDALETQCESGTSYGSCFDPLFVNIVSPFKTLRFVSWQSVWGNGAAYQSAWTDRTLPSWAFWNDSRSNAINFGFSPRWGIVSGVPVEIMLALCNRINADGWFNMPPMASDNYITQFATLAHSTLNSNLNAYVQYANEIWNPNSQGSYVLGTITASVSGATLNVTATTGTVLVHPDQWISGTGGLATTVITAFGTGTGGNGTYTISDNLSTIGSQTWTLYYDANHYETSKGQGLYSSLVGNYYGGINAWGAYREVQVGYLWKAAWGADAARVIRVADGWIANPSGYTNFFLIETPPGAPGYSGGPTYWHSCCPSSCTGSSLNCTGTVASNVEATIVAPYIFFPTYIPDSWTAFPDGGLASFFTQVSSGGLIPSALDTGNCGNGAGQTCNPKVTVSSGTYTSGSGAVSLTLSGTPSPAIAVGDQVAVSGLTGTGSGLSSLNGVVTATSGTTGTTLNYTVATGLTVTTITGGTVTETAYTSFTTGRSLPATPVNGTAIAAKMNATNALSSASTTYLTVDGGTQYPILANDGGCPGNAVNAGQLQATFNNVFVFTNAIAGCSGVSITPGWRMILCYSVSNCQNNALDYPTGAIASVIAQAQSNCTVAGTNGVALLGYESGNSYIATPANTVLGNLFVAAVRDARQGLIYQQYYSAWQKMTGCTVGIINHLYDLGGYSVHGGFGIFGALENFQDTRSPEYDTLKNLATGRPGGPLH